MAVVGSGISGLAAAMLLTRLIAPQCDYQILSTGKTSGHDAVGPLLTVADRARTCCSAKGGARRSPPDQARPMVWQWVQCRC